MTDTKHTTVHLKLWAGLIALVTIILPVLWVNAQTTATLYTDGTNFGIGTTNPTQKLQVIGSISATAFVGDGSGLTGVSANSGWTDGGSNVYTSTTTDNVGIGTLTVTDGKLVVKGAGAATGTAFRVNDSSNTPRVTILDNGNIGLGTNVPAVSLELTNTVKMKNSGFQSFYISQDSSGTFLTGTSGPTQSGNASLYLNTSTGSSDCTTGVCAGQERVGLMIQENSGNIGVGTSAPGGALTVMSGNVGIGTWSSPANRLAIIGNIGIGTTLPYRRISAPNNGMVVEGNVGVGTWNPQAKLQVVGSVMATSFVGDGSGLTGVVAGGWTDAGTNIYTTTTSDRVGIGTANPSSPLEVVSTLVNDVTIFRNTNSSGYANTQYINNSGNAVYVGIGGSGVADYPNAAYVFSNNAIPISFANSSVSRMTIGTAGGVGIGTTLMSTGMSVMNGNVGIGTWSSPANRLSILGNIGIGTTLPYRRISAPNNGMVVEGNVGIGTWYPQAKLQVVGAVRATSFTGDGSGLTGITFSGSLDSLSDAVTDYVTDHNMRIGSDQGLTAGAEGNLFIGEDAGGNAKTNEADYNLGIGYHTLFALLTGDSNVAIGYTSLAANTEGRRNVAIGFSALAVAEGAPDAASYNVAVGYSALASNVTSSANTVVGHLAMDQGTVGDANTVMGSNAARSSEGNYNVSIGYDSMHDNTTGFQNTVLGTSALNNNTDGNNSVAIGYGSLSGMVAGGTENIALGFQAGDNITTGDRNIIIGYDIDAPSDTGDNQLNIANVIYGDIATGNVGIGTSIPVGGLVVMSGNAGIGTWSPTARLQVVGSVMATSFVGDGSGLTGISAGSTGWTDGGTNVYTTSTTDNVGIGTTTPTSTLEVVKTAASTAPLMVSSTATSDGNFLIINSEGNVGIGTVNPRAALSVMNGNIGFGTTSPVTFMQVNSSSTNSQLTISNSTYGGFITAAPTGNDLTFSGGVHYFNGNWTAINTNAAILLVGAQGGFRIATDSGLTPGSTYTPKVRLYMDYEGNVGIGTLDPVGALTIMNGNVGIGTWSPTARLQVVGSVMATSFVGDGSALTGVAAGGWADGGTNVYTSTTTDNVGIGTTTPSNAKLAVLGGNVGIGTVNPVGAFTVVGGNVGLGTWSPRAALEVKNSVVFSSEYDEGSEGGAFTINWNNGNKQKVTLTGSTSHTVTFTAISGGVANFLLKIVQGDASNTITWPASVKWPGASAPTMTAASGSVDIVTCYYDGTNYYCTGSLDLR